MNVSILRIALMLIVVTMAFPAAAQAGLYENLAGESALQWAPLPDSEKGKTLEQALLTPAKKDKYLDHRYEPVVMVRTIFATTMEDRYTRILDDGKELVLDSTKMDPSLFGHREGFILENVELGAKGRFNDSGFYYGVKFELVPREKDGNRSSDYLKDAYVGWNKYSVFDVRIGRMKIPFSQVNMKSTGKMPLIYKPTINTLSPKRQLGGMVTFADPWQVAKLSGGVYNSVKQVTEQLGSTDQLLYVGRLELSLGNLLGALDASVGDLEVRIGGNVAYTKMNFDPETEHQYMGFDAHFHYWIFTLEAEYLIKNFYRDPIDGVSAADQGTGWHVDVTIHAWPGVIDLTGRIEETDPDELVHGANSTLSISELAKQKKRWFSAGVTLHFTDYARLDINYVNRQELEGYSFDNDVVLGMLQLDL